VSTSPALTPSHRVGDRHLRSWDDRFRVEDGDPLAVSGSCESPGDPGRHHGLPMDVERGERLEGVQRLLSKNVLVWPRKTAPNLQRGHG
jgi:hypothetical protein